MDRFTIVDESFIDRSIYFAEKRINELTTWGQEIPVLGDIKNTSSLASSWSEPKIWEFSKYKKYNSWEVTLARYQLATEKLINTLENNKDPNYSTITNNTNKIELKSVLLLHKERLRTYLIKDEVIPGNEKKYLLNLIEGMYIDIFDKLNFSLPDYRNVSYIVEKPLVTGKYEVYLNKKDIQDLEIEGVGINIGGKNLISIPSEKNEWLRFEDITVANKQPLPITLTIQKEPNHIEQTEWEAVEHSIVGTDSATLTTSYDFLGDQTGLIREISSWKPESMYILSFDYRTGDNNFLLAVFERAGTKIKPSLNNVYRDSIRSKQWRNFVGVFLSGKDAKSAFIQINKNQEDIQDVTINNLAKKIEIKNLSVKRFPDPKIILKSVVKPKERIIPNIIFTRINPTKYKVDVYGAKDPYTLVLSQRFNQKWKLYLLDEGKTLDKDKKITKSYANGTLQEGIHQNSFLDSNTFETWGKSPIAENTHFSVNGYANSWYIKPDHVKGNTDYTLIIEMNSQQLFYVSAVISLIGLLLIVFLFLKSLIR